MTYEVVHLDLVDNFQFTMSVFHGSSSICPEMFIDPPLHMLHHNSSLQMMMRYAVVQSY